jgi:hypothetical protein
MKATQESAAIHQPNSARGYVSLRLVGTAKVDDLDGGRNFLGGQPATFSEQSYVIEDLLDDLNWISTSRHF